MYTINAVPLAVLAHSCFCQDPLMATQHMGAAVIRAQQRHWRIAKQVFLLTFSCVAVQQDSHSGASSSRHGEVPSVEEFESQYSCMIEAEIERETAEASKSRLIQALGSLDQVQTDGRGGPWGMPLYAAYMDDVLLQKVFSRPESKLLANPMANTFVRAMSNDAMWLALSFCSYA